MLQFNEIMKTVFATFLLFFNIIYVEAQCTIDYSYIPASINYGLSIDTLANGNVGQMYDEDITFFLPIDTVDNGLHVTFTDFHIISILLPLGMTWECNNSTASCHYDPSITQYGCVNISGTPLISGNYNVDVNLIATHSLSAISGTENISFSLPLTIYPDTSLSSNLGFNMSSSVACTPATISFTNNNVGLLSYFWDFGNGNTSNLEQPVDQIYSQSGQYIVQYSAIQANPIYFLDSIEIVSGNCSDNILIGDVDLLYDINSTNGMIQSVSANNAITQPFPLMISIYNPLQVSGQNVTIDVWDDDGWPWGLEYCGGLTFTPQQQAGVFSENGGGLSINYYVSEIPPNSITTFDTIFVYDPPLVPSLLYDTINNLITSSQDTLSAQWYYFNSPISGATDSFIQPNTSGLYSLVVVNDFGCISSSSDVWVVICDSTYNPQLDYNSSLAWIVDSASYSLLQWYNDDGIIFGANQSFLSINESGMYYVVATDEFGCSYSSESVYLRTNVGLNFSKPSANVSVSPNPISENSSLTIFVESLVHSRVTIRISDVRGNQVYKKTIKSDSFPYQISNKFIQKLNNGVYFLEVITNGQKSITKVMKINF